ncbi:ribonuclease III [Candidatus Marinamargulisbacteria bacterium SCGC AG-414-C22]|nr:ribonuclease III [Candidatus Marinamargulisbacteria bacterium SCGC AG-414-C22]
MTMLKEFQQKLKFKFNDDSLLLEALTHRSYVRGKFKDVAHNERLEFFGDSVLKLIVSEYLFLTFSEATEGDMSKLRSKIISDQFLAKLADYISLGDYLNLSFGEKKSGGSTKSSILANAYEALLGAIYLDQGLDCVRTFFLDQFSVFSDLIQSDEFIDHKSLLQEWCQKNKASLPQYQIVREEGPDHDKNYHIEAFVVFDEVYFFSQGNATSKKMAEQESARYILEMISYIKKQ